MCADTEQELNKWVTGIRVAKYGKQLFTNYRGIVEEMAHDDLDQLASSRFSADPITLAVVAEQVKNFMIVIKGHYVKYNSFFFPRKNC